MASYNRNSYEQTVETPSPHKSGFYTYKDILDTLPDLKYANITYTVQPPYFWAQDMDYTKTLYNSIFYIAEKYKREGLCVSELMIKIDTETSFNIHPLTKYNVLYKKKININDAVNYWRQLMQNKKCKIIFIYTVTHIKNTNFTHANWTIIDKSRKQVEFFDPNGSLFITHQISNWVDLFTNNFQNYIDTQFIPKSYNIVSYDNSCPIEGFQYIENLTGTTISDMEGYCLLWSVYMLDLRMKNIGIPSIKQLQESIIEITSQRIKTGLKSKTTSEKEREFKYLLSLHFKHFIKDYALYLNDLYTSTYLPYGTVNYLTTFINTKKMKRI